jgi:hypothetical protein
MLCRHAAAGSFRSPDDCDLGSSGKSLASPFVPCQKGLRLHDEGVEAGVPFNACTVGLDFVKRLLSYCYQSKFVRSYTLI